MRHATWGQAHGLLKSWWRCRTELSVSVSHSRMYVYVCMCVCACACACVCCVLIPKTRESRDKPHPPLSWRGIPGIEGGRSLASPIIPPVEKLQVCMLLCRYCSVLRSMSVFSLPKVRAWTLWYVNTPRPLHHYFPIRIAAEFDCRPFSYCSRALDKMMKLHARRLNICNLMQVTARKAWKMHMRK